jgi:hypothetical protein
MLSLLDYIITLLTTREVALLFPHPGCCRGPFDRGLLHRPADPPAGRLEGRLTRVPGHPPSGPSAAVRRSAEPLGSTAVLPSTRRSTDGPGRARLTRRQPAGCRLPPTALQPCREQGEPRDRDRPHRAAATRRPPSRRRPIRLWAKQGPPRASQPPSRARPQTPGHLPPSGPGQGPGRSPGPLRPARPLLPPGGLRGHPRQRWRDGLLGHRRLRPGAATRRST